MQDIILKIEENIWKSISSERRIGLLTGLSGIALFYNYLYEVYGNDDFKNKLLIIVEKINTLLEEEASISSLCSGMAGYGLVLLQLKNTEIEIDEEYFESIDNILIEDFEEMCRKNNYDFLHGAMGIAMYFIERYNSKKSEVIATLLNIFSKDLIDKINENFEAVLVSETALENGPCYYFGIAHGVAGYINFLTFLNDNFKDLKEDITKPLKIIISFLASYKKYDNNSKQFYPNLFLLNTNTIVSSRLAWCQGDLGVANSLYNAGIFLSDDLLIREAIELMDNTRKMSFAESFVNDCGICHGSVGILVQYYLADNKFNLNFSDEIDKWMLEVKNQTYDFNEFLAFKNGTYRSEIDLLEGATGLGLAMLTMDNKINFNWLKIINLH
jgi:lantibiotic modifying enzyme